MLRSRANELALAALLVVGATAATEAPAGPLRNDSVWVARPQDLTAGKIVQSPGGEIIGTVRDIVPDAHTGEPDYVLIDTSTGTTALPFWAVGHMLRDAHFVLSPSQLASAPRVPDSVNRADPSWKEEADRYWQAYR